MHPFLTKCLPEICLPHVAAMASTDNPANILARTHLERAKLGIEVEAKVSKKGCNFQYTDASVTW